MRSLYAEPCGYYKSLAEHLPEDLERDLKMAHVTNMPCPVRMCSTPPMFKTHTNNGVIVAVDGETVYATCTYCGLYDKREKSQVKTKRGQGKQGAGSQEKHQGLEAVPGTLDKKYKWYILTEGGYKTMKEQIEGAILPGVLPLFVCLVCVCVSLSLCMSSVLL